MNDADIITKDEGDFASIFTKTAKGREWVADVLAPFADGEDRYAVPADYPAQLAQQADAAGVRVYLT